jgi:hypothetical protein
MKNPTARTWLAVLLLLAFICASPSAYAQLTPLGDAYTNSADPTTNYGAKTLLDVDGATQITYIQFNLSSIPTGASVSQATLKLYVNTVTTAGSFEVYAVNGAWSESTITYDLAPALGSVIDSGVALTTADKNQYILIPMTSTVQGWVTTPSSNNGIALVAIGKFNATFDSKENTTTSHPAELDVVFAGDGTITGVDTASASGLTGGGTSGTLNLSLTNACAKNQVLQWNGSSWACTAAGTGTVTSVGSGTGLMGGPITGSGTLSIASNACASGSALSALPFTCSPFATLGANTFSGSQTVSGNLSATEVVTGSSYQIGSNLFAFGSYTSSNAFLGFAGNSTNTGGFNTAVGALALGYVTSGMNNTVVGALALTSNTSSATGNSNTVIGSQAVTFGSTGTNNTALGAFAGLIPGSQSAIAGSNNTFVGANSDLETGAIGNATAIGASTLVTASNATAIGANAEATESDALVLGSINGVNGATASTNVGIGTTAPAATLEVDGSNQLDIFIKAPASGVGAALDFFTLGSGAMQWEILNTGSGSSQGQYKLNFRDASDGVDVLTMHESGVGILTTSPDSALTVNGSADKPGGGSWGTFSDGRLKTLKGNFSSGLSQILRLNPVRYRYKPDNALGIRDTDEHIGVVAQDVQRVIPEAVTENSKGYLLVNNDPIIWSMLNAIKEQQQEIRDLKSELRATRQSLQKVKAQVARSLTVVAAK